MPAQVSLEQRDKTLAQIPEPLRTLIMLFSDPASSIPAPVALTSGLKRRAGAKAAKKITEGTPDLRPGDMEALLQHLRRFMGKGRRGTEAKLFRSEATPSGSVRGAGGAPIQRSQVLDAFLEQTDLPARVLPPQPDAPTQAVETLLRRIDRGDPTATGVQQLLEQLARRARLLSAFGIDMGL